MSDASAKQQVTDTLKDVESVLVTVNANPSVDELSAALGITVLLNKMGKHATAVFSGSIPPAITFLDPEKTFENTVDSLRDFIIALDKEKADHLRYKVEGEFVKIFITPYRTTIDSKDLDFSQGDYNVEAVLAIGVQNEDDLDRALTDHGRILHDATVMSLSVGDLDSRFGSINWHENDASSYSELVVTIADSLRSDKKLIDEQIATAFLTGIVAATDRFSNSQTTSKSMTMAAQLMAAGANQQLIATRLEEAEAIGGSVSPTHPRGELSENVREKINRVDDVEEKPSKPSKKRSNDGAMVIDHELHGTLDEIAAQVAEQHQRDAAVEAERELSSLTQQQTPLSKTASGLDFIASEPKSSTQTPLPEQHEPAFGGVLNATTEQAAEAKRAAENADKNHQILSHGGSEYVAGPPVGAPALNSFNANSAASDDDNRAPVEPLADDGFTAHSGAVSSSTQPSPFGSLPPVGPAMPSSSPPVASPPVTFPSTTPVSDPISDATAMHQTLADLDAQNRGHDLSPTKPHDDARAAIEAAFGGSPAPTSSGGVSSSAPNPMGSMPPLPPMPDFSTLPPLPGAPNASNPAIDTSEKTLESLLPPLPNMPTTSAPAPTAPVQPSDPGQFRIPGQ